MYQIVIAGGAIFASIFLLGKPALRRYLLGCGLFFLPFSYDYTFYEYSPVVNFVGWTNGIMIRLSDIFFLLIFLLCPRLKRNAKDSPITYWFDRVIILFLVAASVSAYFAIDRKLAALVILQLVRLTFLYYYVPSRFISWSTDGRFITKWLAIALVFQSGLALTQAVFQDFYNFFRSGSAANSTLFGEFIRSQGTAPQPNLFAEYLTIIILVLFSAVLHRRQVKKNNLVWAIVLGMVGLITSMSRGGWLSLVVGAVFLLFYYQYLHKIRNWLGLGCGLAFLLLLFPQTRQRLLGSDEGSAMDRYHLSRIAVEIIKAHPVLGVGINNYRMVLYKYVPEDYEWSFIFIVHTLLLLIAAEMGIPGLIAILLLFARAVWVAWDPVRKSEYGYLAPGIAAACIAINVHNLFDIVWSSEIVSSLFFFLLAVASRSPAAAQKKVETVTRVTVSPPETLVNAS